MDKYYLVVAGAGETSRANVEALIEDYVYGHGQDVVFILPYEKKPSQGQIFTAQLAKDKSKDIIIFCREDANYEGIPSSSVSHSDTPLDAACSKFKGTNVSGFILVDDENPNTNTVLSVFDEYNIPTFDLTEGLMPIKFNPASVGEKEEEPEVPEEELLEEDEEPEDEDDEDLIDEFEEGIEDDELLDDALYGLRALAKIIAKEIVVELLNTVEIPSKGSTK